MVHIFSYQEFKDMFKHRFSRNINKKFLYKYGILVKKEEPLSRERKEKLHRMMTQLSHEINREARFGCGESDDSSASFGESTGILVSNRP